MYCPHCGREIDDKAAICIGCGAPMAKKAETSVSDTGNFGWAVLGFFVPLAGLILWLLWKDSAPKNAKKAGVGALVGTILTALFFIMIFVLYFALIGYVLMY